ncbi:MAG: hypothetical protein WDN69_22410 [Aliidongia sp.]
MEDLPSFQPAPEAPPSDPLPDGASCLAGETVAARTELHVRTLRRFTELALEAAERMNRRDAAEERRALGAEARAEAAKDALIEIPAAEMPAAEAPAAEVSSEAPPRATPPGEMSLALFRLSRLARYDIALELKLLEDLAAPPSETQPDPSGSDTPPPAPERPRSRWCKPDPAKELAERREAAERYAAEALPFDMRLMPDDIEDLLAELRAELASGRHDKRLLKDSAEEVGSAFIRDRGVRPNYARMYFGDLDPSLSPPVSVQNELAIRNERPIPNWPQYTSPKWKARRGAKP